MTIEFIPTAGLINEISPDVRSCDTQMHNLGDHLEFCGKASTVKCFQDSTLLEKALSKSSEGGVLVISGDASIHTALIGDVITGLGKDNGWAGVVVNGTIHDSKLTGEINFSYKTLGANPHRSTKTGEGERDAVISFGGIDFVPGETLYADSDDIVVH